jgi:hypothetical protein
VNALDSQITQTEKSIISLLWTKNWSIYKTKVDVSLEKISGNEEIVLKKIKEWEVKYKGKKEKTDKIKYLLLEYIRLSLEEKIAGKANILLKENIIKEQSQITEIEKKEVERSILSIEKIIKTKTENTQTKNIFQTGISQSGKIALVFSTNLSSQGIYSGNINLDNLTVKQQGTDMQANSSVSIDLKDPNGETKLKAFFDAILKDKNSYFLVDKLEILKENEQVKPFLEMLKKIDEKNAYIKQEGTSDVLDWNITSVVETLKKKQNFSFENLFSKKIFFEAYKKEKVGTYSLIPTKELCNLLKSYSWNDEKECSEKESFDLIKPFIDGTINLQININGNINTLSLLIKETGVSIDASTVFSQNDLEKISFNATPDEKIFPWEKVSLYYKKNEKITMLINSDNEKIEWNMLIILDENNAIKSGNGNITSPSFKWNFEIKEKTISGSFKVEDQGKEKISWTIRGKIGWDGTIETLQIQFWGKAVLSQQDTFSGKLIFSKSSNTVNIAYQDTKNDFSFDIQLDKKSDKQYTGNIIFSYQEEKQNKVFCRLDFDITTTFWDVKIEAPKNSLKLEEVLNEPTVNK